MTDPSQHIGKTLRRIRFEQDLTLDQASQLTGVSKAMLGQIERGESNPTVSILWKVASGLRISFTELLNNKSEEYDYVNIKESEPVLESGGRMRVYDVFSFNPISGFEYLFIELLPGAHHISEEHKNAIEEFIVVTEGTLLMTIDDIEYTLKAPSAIVFTPDNTHIYSNPFEEKAVFQNIIKY